MPTYDYQCQSCRNVFSVNHKIGESAPNCPDCGGEVKKLLSAPAVHRGGGKAEAAPQGCGAGACGCKHLH